MPRSGSGTSKNTDSYCFLFYITTGSWLQKIKGGASTDMNSLYSDIEDRQPDRDSGQYSTIDIDAPKSKNMPFSYMNNDRTPSGFGSDHSAVKMETVGVTDKNDGTTSAQVYSVPVKPRKPPRSTPVGDINQLYAQPDKSKKLKLTSQSSAYSETQMVENDLYSA